MKQNISLKALLIAVLSAGSVCYAKSQAPEQSASQNFSVRYNYLYNAKEILAAYERLPSDLVNEAFIGILPVFGSRPTAREDMDAVIRKARFILAHKNSSKYSAAAKALLSRAYFNNRDFNSSLRYAEQTLESDVTDRDLRTETRVLQIRSLIALSKFNEGRTAASILRDELQANPKKNAEAHATLAQIYLLDGQYEPAKQELRKSGKMSNSAENKWRWIHIQAQLEEKLGHHQEAEAIYKSVKRNSTTAHIQLYGELAHIRLNSANKTSGKSTEQQLLQLTKTSAYENLLDVIYYTLAENSKTHKESGKATSYYSIAKRRSQDAELKARADIQIGDLNLYTAKKYRSAELHYDSALMSLPASPASVQLKDYAHSLKRIAKLYQEAPNLDSILQIPASSNSSGKYLDHHYEIATIYLLELGDIEKSAAIYHSLLKAFPGNRYEKLILQVLNQKSGATMHNVTKNSFVQNRQQSTLLEIEDESIKSRRRLALDYRPSIKWVTYAAKEKIPAVLTTTDSSIHLPAINTPQQTTTPVVTKNATGMIKNSSIEIAQPPVQHLAVKKSPSSQYYFAVVIEDPQIRLAPFRFRIGEFNRGRRPELDLKHRVIEFSNSQVIYVGVFKSIEVAEAYANEIRLQMPAIMKETNGKFGYRILSKEDLEQLEAAELYKEEKPGLHQTPPHQH